MRLLKALAYFGFFSVIVSSLMVAQTPTWSHLTPTGTGPMLNSNPAVYDPTSDRLIIFGGLAADGSCCTSDTWILTNANGVGGNPAWQKLAPTGTLPPSRISHSAVYDLDNNRLIIFAGGVINSQCFAFCALYNDVWVLSNANGNGGAPVWNQLTPAGTLPPARSAQAAVYDPVTKRMVIFGGGDDGIGDLNDTWVLTNANGIGSSSEWIRLSPGGGPPSPREVAMVSYDPVANTMTIFGGSFQSDLWILSNANVAGNSTPTWQQITQNSPAPGTLSNWNSGHDQAANAMIFFGGSPSFGEFRNDVWELHNANGTETPTWQQLIPNGQPGSPPAGAFMGSYDPNLQRLMIVPDATDLWVLPLNSKMAAPLQFFPLKGTASNQDVKLGPWIAPIITVFDHSMADSTGKFHIYGFDGIVESFTSEVGECSYTPPPCPAKRDGYYNSGNTAFGVNGHYIGDSSDRGTLKLQYEGHPGFDYKASCTENSQKKCILGTGTNVYAVSSGTLDYPSTMVGLCSSDGCAAEYHVMELIPSSSFSHLVYYLHLSTYPGGGTVTANDPSPAPGCPSTVALPLPKGTHVGAGCLIGQSGNSAPPPGVGPHLHFEVQAVLPRTGFPSSLNCQVNGAKMACVPVDPYGWTCGLDPYSQLLPISNSPLWNYEAYLSSSALCFGQASVGTTAQQTLTLTNVAASSLSPKSASVGGADAGDFSQSNNCPPTIPSGSSCQFTVTFDPVVTGARSATLTLTGKDGGGHVRLVVNLSGYGS